MSAKIIDVICAVKAERPEHESDGRCGAQAHHGNRTEAERRGYVEVELAVLTKPRVIACDPRQN